VLSDFHIPVKAQHTGGSQGRKIVFNTLTGKVQMKLLQKTGAVVNAEINTGFNY
jgi:chemotaxis receptor (MCP) glutamine deamidase CheD